MILLIVVASFALLVVGICAWWLVPKWQMRSVRVPDPKDRADIEDNFRKTVGQGLTGLFVLLGAGIAYWGTFQTLQANQQSARDLLISNQVSKGFEQLASQEIITRLGGIYALEGVMKTSEEYHQPVLEALCAFVRDRTQTVTGDGPPATDIQAALTVIGRRAVIAREMFDFTGVHIPKANLFNANLSRAVLRDADLKKAFLTGADLHGANLIGADLREAALLHTDLHGAYLKDAHLNGADLRGGADLTDAYLKGADLSGIDLRGAIIKQAQLDEACGTDAKLDPGLTLKPC